MLGAAKQALLKIIADHIESSTERCLAANKSEAHSAEMVALSHVSISRSRYRIAQIDSNLTAGWWMARREFPRLR